MIDETFYKWNLAPYPSGKIYPGGGGGGGASIEI